MQAGCRGLQSGGAAKNGKEIFSGIDDLFLLKTYYYLLKVFRIYFYVPVNEAWRMPQWDDSSSN